MCPATEPPEGWSIQAKDLSYDWTAAGTDIFLGRKPGLSKIAWSWWVTGAHLLWYRPNEKTGAGGRLTWRSDQPVLQEDIFVLSIDNLPNGWLVHIYCDTDQMKKRVQVVDWLENQISLYFRRIFLCFRLTICLMGDPKTFPRIWPVTRLIFACECAARFDQVNISQLPRYYLTTNRVIGNRTISITSL